MKRIIAVIAVLALLLAAYGARSYNRPPEALDISSIQEELSSITSAEIQAAIEYLAGPEMLGRRADTPESAMVAEFLAKVLEDSNFQPIDEDYLQKFCLFEDVQTTDYDYRVWDYFAQKGWNVPKCATNVAGIYPGTTKADEYIVLVAHRDHVGLNPSRVAADNAAGDKNGHVINPGADDNATGTAGLMEIAQAIDLLAQNGTPLERSVIILFADAEEFGLWGSRYFVENPPVPLDQIVSVINLDMIGRNNRDKLRVIGSPKLSDFAARNPELAAATFVAAEYLGFSISYPKDAGADSNVFMRSDHFSFYDGSPANDRIPVVFFTGGSHDDYHRPTDTPSTIDFVKVRDISRLALLVLWQISGLDDAPDFIE